MANLGYLQITRRCNQKCRFCSNPEREVTMKYADGEKYIKKLKKSGYIGVLFTGGEPTISEYLPRFIRYCGEIHFMHKLITNGQKLADSDYLAMLVESGLKHVCLSFHSCKPDVQNYLSQNENSYKNLVHALNNLSEYRDIVVDILTTINKFNASHLSDNVKFLMENYPFIHHFSWNNLDPRRNRTSQYPEVIPTLRDFELELKLAMDYLHASKKLFQVERVPLCYMAEYAHLSTETRKIVKDDERIIHFLDERGTLVWQDYMHGKAARCKICTVESICAGLIEMDTYYSSDELYPLFIDKDRIVARVMSASRAEIE